jgi:hypothetical protein
MHPHENELGNGLNLTDVHSKTLGLPFQNGILLRAQAVLGQFLFSVDTQWSRIFN